MRIIGGIYKGRKIKTIPPAKAPLLRPTTDRVKESVFSILNPYISGTKFLDLFAGSGNVGIEAISRGASRVYFVESDKKLCNLIAENLDSLGISRDNYKIMCMDYMKALKSFKKRKQTFDFIYADPPYERDYYVKIINMVKNFHLLDKDGLLIIEEPKKNPFIPGDYPWIVERRNYGTTTVTFINFSGEN